MCGGGPRGKSSERVLRSRLIDHRAVARRRDRLTFCPRGLQPSRLGALELRQRLLRCLAEGRARLKVRDVGDVAAVLFAVEDVDVIVAHESSPNCRLYRSISRSSCRIWYGFA